MPVGDVLDEETERIAKIVVDSMYRVHQALGAGLLESIYMKCLTVELESRSLTVEREVYVPILYQGQTIEPGLRLDMLVEGKSLLKVNQWKFCIRFLSHSSSRI